MDTIDTFLDAMFAPYPSTPRLLEAKGELRAMMEDAYADAVGRGKTHNEAVGQVITDFGNLEELAPVLGILPDIRSARADDAAAAAYTATGTASAGAADPTDPAAAAPLPQDDAPSDYPVVTLPEAQALAEARRRTGRLLGRGVALFVLAPIPLIAAANLTDDNAGAGLGEAISDGLSNGGTGSGPGGQWAVLIGLALTLVLVATGVLTLMRRHQAFAGLEHLTDGKFTRNPIVSAWAARLRVENEGPRSRALMAAVGLWILSAIPTVAGGILSDQPGRSHYPIFGVSLTLALVAAGLLILLPTTWASSTHETLTEEGHWTGGPGQWDRWGRKDADNPLIGAIASIYWPLTLVIFLAWGFLGNGWAICWIVWPISGILFGAIASFISVLSRGRTRH
ncbi:permease prefix domain 1-containing protein [Actinomyces sp. oral taxon 414]|uniref:permease prefix domain 1-containing protein n=1 Tax=Actinomyces sp. oral taxon 414 TaxID=712122 RepID=UPI0006B04F1D|nr:permease prefix domain 1-containing protein [Actinomyces sp. oral taxon 414]